MMHHRFVSVLETFVSRRDFVGVPTCMVNTLATCPGIVQFVFLIVVCVFRIVLMVCRCLRGLKNLPPILKFQVVQVLTVLGLIFSAKKGARDVVCSVGTCLRVLGNFVTAVVTKL